MISDVYLPLAEAAAAAAAATSWPFLPAKASMWLRARSALKQHIQSVVTVSHCAWLSTLVICLLSHLQPLCNQHVPTLSRYSQGKTYAHLSCTCAKCAPATIVRPGHSHIRRRGQQSRDARSNDGYLARLQMLLQKRQLSFHHSRWMQLRQRPQLPQNFHLHLQQ